MLEFTVSKTYEIITEESAAEGDADDLGYVYEDRTMDLRDLLRELEDCTELSDSHCGDRTWATSYGSMDMFDGSYTNESIHIHRIRIKDLDRDGKEPTAHQLKRIYKLAKLIK
jgi:hypothetical protein